LGLITSEQEVIEGNRDEGEKRGRREIDECEQVLPALMERVTLGGYNATCDESARATLKHEVSAIE